MACDLQTYRERRREVQLRHARLLDQVDHVGEGKGKRRARDHYRWPALAGDAEAGQLGKQQASGEKEEGHQNSPSLLGPGYFPAERTIRNDYSQHYIDTCFGVLPGNAVQNPYSGSRFAEYPKLGNLIRAKAALLEASSIAPTYLQADLLPSLQPGDRGEGDPKAPHTAFRLMSLLPIKFDVVVIDPPLEAYEWESCPQGGVKAGQAWSWDQLAALPIPQIMAKESFVFLWVGSGAGDGLERGREALMRWGYRRCEDIVWIRTNEEQAALARHDGQMPPTCSAFTQTVQHCLMGIRGTVTRSRDTHFVHCNIDTDVILWPGEASLADPGAGIDVRCKPPEMMDLIENFCLGTRRLELFGRNRNLRRGWLTVGLEVGPGMPGFDEAERGQNACAARRKDRAGIIPPVQYSKQTFDTAFSIDRAGCSLRDRSNLIPYSEEIDLLRPRTPPASDRRGTKADGGPVPSHYRAERSIEPTAMTTGGSHHFKRQAFPAHSRHGSVHHFGSNPAYASGAGLSGLGAGGNAVVSVPSGSELLSGAQANVIFGTTHAGLHSAATSHAGPAGLGRKSRRPV